MRLAKLNLAAKCQVLFSLAVLLILTAALGVVGLRMSELVRQRPLRRAQDLGAAWAAGHLSVPDGRAVELDEHDTRIVMQSYDWEAFVEAQDPDDPFVADAVEAFRGGATNEADLLARRGDDAVFFFARAVRGEVDAAPGAAPVPPVPDRVLVVELTDNRLLRDLAVNRLHTVFAGLAAGLLALGVFWLITARLVLSPVRTLRQYAAKVSEGDLNLRADLNTGDEFQELADMFNRMLGNLKTNTDALQAANKSLDLKLGELAESNEALDRANQVKSDFLANVSHELRTPLNSIIGFGEVLAGQMPEEGAALDAGDKAGAKQRRYVNNIITSSKRLLDLINDLLDLAKIEAGRLSVTVSAVSPADTCEGLVNLMRPTAEADGVALKLKLDAGLPVLQTDAGKLQQVLFNFLSNAVKFTPREGVVTLAVRHLPAASEDELDEVRFSVTDTGPGIAPEDQGKVFDKFNQLDPAVTREHGGTGLGLTISQQLAGMLQGRIELDSAVGRGSTFSLTIPVSPRARVDVLMPGA